MSVTSESPKELRSGEEESFRQLPEGLWDRLRSQPADAPQFLALAATERWGQPSRLYAEKLRRDNPQATPQQLATMAKKRYAALARLEGAAAGIPGTMPFYGVAGAAAAMVPDLAALAWIQSRMVMDIAAVYGHDTSSKDMAAQLLVLQGFYNTTDAARLAVVKAGQEIAEELIMLYVKGSTLVLLRQLFRYVGIRFTRTGLLKAEPLVAVPLSAGVNELSTRSLGKRAIKFYDTAVPS